MAQINLNRRQIGALLRLRGKLTWRQFTRERGRILMAVIALLIFGPMVAGATIGTAVGYRQLTNQWPTALLGGVLVALWGIWLLFPILFSSLNEGLDITRLLIYPMSSRDLIAGTLLGTLFDYPTYLMLPLFGAAIVGFGITPALPILLIGLLLCYAHMVLIGQLVITTIGGILQSRRFRDLSIIIASLFGFSCYFINQGVGYFAENMSQNFSEEQLLALQPLNWLQWLPTGAVARAFEQALRGRWETAVFWLLYSSFWLFLIGWVWLRQMTRLATGQGFLINARPKAEQEKPEVQKESQVRNRLLTSLPVDLSELIQKELKSVWRFPQRRVGLIQGVVFPFFMVVPFLLNNNRPFTIPSWIGLILLPNALFIFWSITQNMLAWEADGLATLLLSPIPRERIFLGKGVALMLVAGAPFTVIGLVLVIVSWGWLSVGAVLTGLSLGLAVLAVTAVSSVLFPMRINLAAKSTRSSFQSGGGCLSSLGSVTLTPIIIGTVSIPAAAPLLLGFWLEQAWIGIVGIPISFTYSTLLFKYGTKLAGNLLLEREPELLAQLQQPDEIAR